MYTFCIAEDEYYVQKSIQGRIRALAPSLVCLGCAFTGEEAERLYERFHPDLFFVDINMPGEDGISFIENVRRKHDQSRTLFITVTGYSDYQNMSRAIRADVYDYVLKPIVPEEFSRMLIRVQEELERLRVRFPAGSFSYENHPGIQETEKAERENSYRVQGREDWTEQICRYIQEHYAEDISVKTLSDTFHLSQGHISHMFKKHVGRSPGKYLEDTRLSRAYHLLLSTDLLVLEVAEHVGYRDGNYFTKCFRKKYDLSPSEIRSGQGQKSD